MQRALGGRAAARRARGVATRFVFNFYICSYAFFDCAALQVAALVCPGGQRPPSENVGETPILGCCFITSLCFSRVGQCRARHERDCALSTLVLVPELMLPLPAAAPRLPAATTWLCFASAFIDQPLWGRRVKIRGRAGSGRGEGGEWAKRGWGVTGERVRTARGVVQVMAGRGRGRRSVWAGTEAESAGGGHRAQQLWRLAACSPLASVTGFFCLRLGTSTHPFRSHLPIRSSHARSQASTWCAAHRRRHFPSCCALPTVLSNRRPRGPPPDHVSPRFPFVKLHHGGWRPQALCSCRCWPGASRARGARGSLSWLSCCAGLDQR